MEGLVCKSKGFLPMNLSNPKGESFDIIGISGVGGGRSKSAGLKDKFVGGFSQGITWGFFNPSNRAQVMARSFR